MSKRRTALYLRMSTDKQTVENQELALRLVASDEAGKSLPSTVTKASAAPRDAISGLDQMLKDASRGNFNIAMAWAIDRIGRSLVDLLSTIQHLDACGCDLYLDQQAIDTTTPMGKLIYQVSGAFAEFERSMIQQRVCAGLARASGTVQRIKAEMAA